MDSLKSLMKSYELLLLFWVAILIRISDPDEKGLINR